MKSSEPVHSTTSPTPISTTPMPTPINGTLQKKRGSRRSSFTPSEDEAIAKAWIAVSENTVVGAEQKGTVFVEAVRDIYSDKFKPANRDIRTMESVKIRCRTIHKECMRFAGCHAHVVCSHPTGVFMGDMVNMATALYNDMEINGVENDCGKPFRFIKSWRILRKHAKYMGGDNDDVSKDGSTEQRSPELSMQSGAELITKDIALVTANVERPIGRKRARENQTKADEAAKKIKLTAEAVKAQKNRNVTLKRHYEIVLFTNAPSGCDISQSVEYFNTMRARVLAELRSEESNENQDAVE